MNVTPLIEKAMAGRKQAEAAEAFGVKQPTLCEALKLGRVGPRLAIGIEKDTGGEVSKSDLRPDLWPREPGQPAPSTSQEAN